MSKHSSCPFCGSKENQTVTDDGIGWVKCNGCGATGPIFSKYSGEEDREYISWESRAEAQALREEVAALKHSQQILIGSRNAHRDERDAARKEVAALRARVVVFPDFDNDVIIETFRRNGFLIELGASYSVKGQIAQLLNSLEGLARIKGKAVSEGLLRSACVVIRRQLDGCTNPSEDRDAMQVCDSIEALLGEGKEVGDVPSA